MLSLCSWYRFPCLYTYRHFIRYHLWACVIIASALADFLAGATIPLPFFPQPFRAISEFLPFASMQNMPLRIYIGHIAGLDAAWGIGLQAFWLIIFLLTGKFMMKNALHRVVVQGG
jgi:ABC-2 type transport system permease protein